MMRPRRLLVVYAGGTIGMRPGAAGLVPSRAFARDLEGWCAREPLLAGYPLAIETIEPPIDSADATPAHWMAMARLLWRRRASYDAAVVLHGTDTLAYAASALSFFLLGLCKPIILTGSLIPFAQSGSDAHANLRGALRCALVPAIEEVCIFFDGRLLRGNRTQKAGTRPGRSFASPHWPALARARPMLKLNANALLHSDQPLRAPAVAPHASIGLLKLYPGMSASVVAVARDSHPDGLVLELYGAGTGPLADRALTRALERAASLRTPLIAVSQCRHGAIVDAAYASGRRYREIGIVSGHDLTTEAALTKLHYLQATGRSDLASRIARPLAGEVSPSPGPSSSPGSSESA